MVSPDTFRLWERQRELAREKEQQRRVRELLDSARQRLWISMVILKLT